jgi:SWI/SNF-related matrix-associated actin-dependent regulator 1 of chromatin subfamily A
VPLNPKIRKLYNEILATHLKNKGNKKAIGGNQAARQHLFTTLRKVANHPLLLRNRYSSDSDVDHLASHLRMYGYFGHDDACTLGLVKKELEKFSDFDIHLAALDVIDENPIRRDVMSRYVLAEEDMFCSPKLEKLRTLIPDLVNNGHRLLIFSQWTNCLDLLGCLMESLKYKFFRLDGQTAISTRQAMINDFNNDPTVPVFLLSTKAGGMGKWNSIANRPMVASTVQCSD